MRIRTQYVHAFLITLAILIFIWLLHRVRVNYHYLNPFGGGRADYEITDVVSAKLTNETDFFDDRILIVNVGRPDRTRLAGLLDKLSSAGAAAIGIDLYLTEFEGKRADTLLNQSIRAAGNIVLACLLEDGAAQDDQFESIGGVAPFFQSDQSIGYGNFPTDASRTVRHISPAEQVGNQEVSAFSTAILEKYDPNIAAAFRSRGNVLERINFRGHKSSFLAGDIDFMLDSMSLSQVSRAARGKIVLVGYAPDDPWLNPLVDRHYTPLNPNYGGKSIPDMFGVFIHANVLSMVLDGKYIYTVPWWLSSFASIILCFFNVLLFRRLYHRMHKAFHGVSRAIQLVEFLLLFFLAALLFYAFNVKLDLGIGVLGVLLAYDFIMIYESLEIPQMRWFAGLAHKDEEE